LRVHHSEESLVATPGGPEGTEYAYFQNYHIGAQSIDLDNLLEFCDFVADTNLLSKEIIRGTERYNAIKDIVKKYRTSELKEEILKVQMNLRAIFEKNKSLNFVKDFFFKHREIFDIERVLPELDNLYFDPVLDRTLEVENFSYDEYTISREEDDVPPSPEDTDTRFLKSFEENLVLEDADLDTHLTHYEQWQREFS